MEDCGKMKA